MASKISQEQIDEITQHLGLTDNDLIILDALAYDINYGPLHRVEEDCASYSFTDNDGKMLHFGSWCDANGESDKPLYDLGSKVIDKFREECFVNTEWDEVFFGSEYKLEQHIREDIPSFETWVEEDFTVTGVILDDPTTEELEETYEQWVVRELEFNWQRWLYLDDVELLGLFVSHRTARELLSTY